MAADILPHVAEVAEILDGEDWLLVGGAMTQVHCAIGEVVYERPTSDVDIVVDPVEGSTLIGVAARLERNGFERVEQLHSSGALHRFQREDGFAIDVMGKDSSLTPNRWMGFRVVKCPGSKSALGQYSDGERKEILQVDLSGGWSVRVPNVWSALAIKGWALRQPDSNRERHVQDSLALLACASATEPKRRLTKSERQAINFVLSSDYLGHLENWGPLSDRYWQAALKEIRRLRPQGEIGVPEPLKPLLPKANP